MRDKESKENFEDISRLWRVHTPNFLNDIIMNLGDNTGCIVAPMHIFKKKLRELADLAIKIDDPRLHLIMCQLCLYESSDPSSEEYDKDIFDKLQKQITESNL